MASKTRHIAGLIGFLAVLAILGAYGIVRRGFSARTEPTRAEAFLARTMRSLAVPAKAKDMKNPLPSTPANVQAGLEHFADHCAICHANNGSGDTEFGRGMYPKPPDMRTGQTQNMTDGEIYYTIQNGVRLTGMPAFGSSDRDDDSSTWQLIHFIRHLPKLTTEKEQQMRRFNPRSPAELEEEKAVEDFLKGEEPSDKQPTHKH